MTARMFADSLFEPSPTGLFFKDLLRQFNGRDTVDMVVMETGNMANIDLPAPDKIVPKTLSPEFDKQWGLDAARFREAHRLSKGRGVRVAVMDTGIDMTHPVFQDTVWGSHYNFVGRDGLPWVKDGPPMVDWGWHGTVVSSIVAKYAPEARITLYRYLDGDSQNDSRSRPSSPTTWAPRSIKPSTMGTISSTSARGPASTALISRRPAGMPGRIMSSS